MKNTFKTDIRLGERYRDEQTGIEGIATSIHFYQHACERVAIEKMKTDGELMEIVFDSPRLTHIATGIKATTSRTGGPARAGETRSVASR